MTARFLHTADWHLGHAFASFGEAAARRREDQRQAIARLVDLAIAEKVHAFLIAGDLFDSTRPDGAALGVARQALDRLAAAGIPAFAVAGTHDYLGLENGRPVLAHENLHWFDAPACDKPVKTGPAENPLWLYGLSALPGKPADLDSLKSRGAEGTHVALLHATVLAQTGLAVEHKDLPVTPPQLANLQLDYVALGHFHTFAEIRFTGRLVGCYPGTPESLRFGETGPRLALLVTADRDGVHVFPHAVGSGVCAAAALDCAGSADEAALVHAIEAHGGANVYARLRLQGLIDEPLDPEALHARTADRFAYLELVDETDLSASHRLADLAREPSVRGHAISLLLRHLEGETDPRQRRLAQRALAHLVLEFDRHRSGGAA